MSEELKNQITELSKKFASAFKDTIGGINGSGWLIVDPLSGYLNACGYENKLFQIKASGDSPQVLIITFKDDSQFIPAGGDLKDVYTNAENWMWL